MAPSEEADIRTALAQLVGPTGQPGRIFGRDCDRATSEVSLGEREALICRLTAVMYECLPEHQAVDLGGVRWSEGRVSI